MEELAVLVAMVAVFATIISATRSSIRNEAHHLVSVIQGILNELSDLSHSKASAPYQYEALCNLKCDLLESSLNLLVRRCSSRFFFDADVETFRVNFIALLSRLRDDAAVSDSSSVDGFDSVSELYRTNAYIKGMYALVNGYVGERFRPIFEKRECSSG